MTLSFARLPEHDPDPAAADPVALASARQRQAAGITRSAWVAASAGSGKTKLLTDRVVNLLLAGVTPDSILCLTYTRAAASEMAGRVARRLADWVRMDDSGLCAALAALGHSDPDPGAARQLFAALLDHPLGLNINTIHGFCQSLLARFPLEAGLPPDFGVLEDADAGELLREALHQVLAENAPDLAPCLDRLAAVADDGTALKVLRSLLSERTRLRACLERYGAGFPAALADWLEIPADLDAAMLDAALCTGGDDAALRAALVILIDRGSDAERRKAAVLDAWLAATPEGRRARVPDYCKLFLTTEGKPREKLVTKATQAADSALRQECGRLVELMRQQRALRVYDDTCALYTAALTVWQRYTSLKATRGQFDFADLIEKVERLLLDREETAWVLYKLDQRIRHILVDEAQDTSPLQWQILAKLSEDFFTGETHHTQQPTLLVVGDAKQSIYSFQGAAPELFQSQRQTLQTQAHAIGHDFPTIPLDVSFRSTDVVLDCVDAVFAAPPASIGVTETAPVRHLARRAGGGGCVTLWPPVTVDPPEITPWCLPTTRRTDDKADIRLADQVARQVASWLRSGDIIPDSTGQPLRPQDILILLQHRKPLQGALLRALKAAGVPVAGADRLRLMDHLAVQDLVALGRFLCLPDDDLSLACVLKSPLCNLTEEQLFTLCHNRPGSLWHSLGQQARQGDEQTFVSVHATLRDLVRRAGYMTPADLFAHILNQGGRQQMLARLGAEAREPLDAFEEQVQAFTHTHVPSLPRCLAWLVSSNPEIKRETETEAAGVRIMTVHGAKGLEAPVVILPDSTRAPGSGGRDSVLWAGGDDGVGADLFVWGCADDLKNLAAPAAAKAARQEMLAAEQHRLLYVALTRAADRLYLGGVGKAPEGSWYQLVEAGLDRLGDAVVTAPCPLFGQVRRLARDARAPVGHPPAAHPATADDMAPPDDLPNWLRTPAAREEKPPLEAVAAREHDESALAPSDRSAALTGDLMHLLLQKLPQIPLSQRREVGGEILAALVPHQLPAERDAVVNTALAVLADPQLAFLFAAGEAEVPVLGTVNGRRISGRIDRLVVMPDCVHLVDFKTTLNPPTTIAAVQKKNPEYIEQLAIYRQVLQAIYPQHLVRAWLVWTATQVAMPIPDAVLDAAIRCRTDDSIST